MKNSSNKKRRSARPGTADSRKRNSNSAPARKFANAAPKVYEGKVEMTRSGSAYIICENRPDKDILVRFSDLNGALNNDKVSVKVTRKNGSREEGVIIKVKERGTKLFMGTIHVKKLFAFVLPDRRYGMVTDIFIPIKDIKGAKDGDRVLCAITDYNEKGYVPAEVKESFGLPQAARSKKNKQEPQAEFRRGRNPIGIVTEIISEDTLNRVMWQTILLDNGFELEFPKEVLDEAHSYDGKITAEEEKKRRDFREITTFTIDPVDAKDFDDALSFQHLPNGNYEVGIHIADVSHYMPVNSELDKFAALRATSVYLVDGTLPMLPERLSNELCSLRPNEDKYCFAAVFELDSKGKIYNEWFGRTIIHSKRRFAYEEAQEVIETGKGDLADELGILNRIAHALRDERFKKGSINFDTVEPRFKLDANGQPTAIVLKERKDAHLLIEDYMLLANRRVAFFLSKKTFKGRPIPFPYRVHDLPDLEKLRSFNQFAHQFGLKIDTSKPDKIAKSFNEMLVKIKGHSEENILMSLGIRSMAKAIYTTKNIGHYGLGFDFYCHFTSPIRRYPDVLTHRVLATVLESEGSLYAEAVMENLCKISSEQERKAATAERDSIKFMQALFMKKHIGEKFDGVISGITNFGMFVEIQPDKCEGMIPVKSLGESVEYDENSMTLYRRYTGQSYTLGQKVRVLIKDVSPDRREIDLVLLDEEA